MATKKKANKTGETQELQPVEEMLSARGLPREAYAIVGDPTDPLTWKMPHHAAGGEVDWKLMAQAAEFLQPMNHRGQAAPEQIFAAARHLAKHYQKAGKIPPNIVSALG